MARQIAPGAPADINAKLVDVKAPDFSTFEKLGDEKIKAANKSFELYTEATYKQQTTNAYNQFKNNPIELANALGKIQEGLLSGLPEDMQDRFKSKMFMDNVSLVQKAQTNQENEARRQYKVNALSLAKDTNESISTDYFNLLVNMSSESPSPIYEEMYAKNRLRLRELADLTDENGKLLFSETDRTKMQMPKESTVAGFKQFIDRFELNQLEDWDKNVFQNRDKFIKDTLIDGATYDSLDEVMKKRIKALKDTSSREIHGQAFYDAANLITEPIQANVDKAKEYGMVSPRIIDRVVKASKDATAKTYAYDPARKTSPGAFIQALNDVAETMRNNDWSFEGREKAIGQAADALKKLEFLAGQTNMAPETVEQIEHVIRNVLVDKNASAILEQFTNMQPDLDYSNSETIDYAKIGSTILQKSAYEDSKQIANMNYEQNINSAINSFIMGDFDTFQQLLYQSDIQYKRDLVGFMPFSKYQWDMWEKDVEKGKDVVIEYMGNQYRFNGFSAQKPLTLINLL